MDALLLARWQFGITTAYHFLFVPLTIGAALLTAVLQTAWLCSGRPGQLLATKFWGELFLIAFALGSATGIVQEFQLGMAWSEHFRFVGDGFGAQPATEGLLAFFLVSVLLGLWIFGWERLPRGVHTACIWLAALGIMLSAYLVLAPAPAPASAASAAAAPTADGAPGTVARLSGARAMLGDPTRLIAFAPTVAAALLVGGALLVAGSAWHLRRNQHRETMLTSLRLGLWSTLIGGTCTAVTGGIAIKALTGRGAANNDAGTAVVAPSHRLPHLLPHPLPYPLSPLAQWGHGVVVGAGLLAVLTALFGLWHTRAAGEDRGRTGFHLVATHMVPLIPIGASVGWALTATGRQPRPVHDVLRAARANSPVVGADRIWILLTLLTLSYALLAVVEVGLVLRSARRGPAAPRAWDADVDAAGPEPELGFAY